MFYKESENNAQQWEIARKVLREDHRDLLDNLNSGKRRDGDSEFSVFDNKYFANRVGAITQDTEALPDVYNLGCCHVFWAKNMNEFNIYWKKLLEKLEIVQAPDGKYYFAEEYQMDKTENKEDLENQPAY